MPLGVEFQVNSYTPGYQRYPSVGSAANGAFVVVWTDAGHDGSFLGVFGQRFDSSGLALGAEFQINTATFGFQRPGKVASEPDGDFVVVWGTAGTSQDGDASGVFGQRFASTGARLGSEFQVNRYTPNDQNYPAVAIDGDGDFVVVWTSYLQDGGVEGVFGQRFDSSGAKSGAEFQVSSYTLSTQRTAAVAVESNGDFVAVWDSANDGDASFGVRAQRFGSDGARLGGEFAVNSYTTGGQYAAAVGMDADGDFVVAWTSYLQDGAAAGVFARRYDSGGASVGGEFQVNTFTSNFEYTVFGSLGLLFAPGAVALDGDGDFVVVWSGLFQDGFVYPSAFGQRFSSVGSRVGAEFPANSNAAGTQNMPSTAMEADGDFVVAWTDRALDGSGYGIFARRFGGGGAPVATPTPTPSHTATPTVTPTPTGPTPTATATPTVTPTVTPAGKIDVDANGDADALTDGLLILRRMFGFSAGTLTSGAVASDCNRCDAGSIATYIDSNLMMLDIDDNNGDVEPLTDGLLILRRLFGFSDAALITGALATDCNRCEAGQIADYIDSLTM